MRNIYTFIILFGTIIVNAMDEIPELVTDRPDKTESSRTVPHKSLQIETGFVMEKKITEWVEQYNFAYNSTLLRYGLMRNFELRLGMDYLEENYKIKSSDSTYTKIGFSPLYSGFKINIAEEEGWKPEIAFIGGLILPFTADRDFKPDFSGINVLFSFSHSLSNRFSFGYNLGVEWSGEDEIPSYIYSAVIAYSLIEDLGIYFEGYGHIPEEGESEHLLDGGLTYQIIPNMQLDVSGGIGIQNSIDSFIGLGLTYRILK